MHTFLHINLSSLHDCEVKFPYEHINGDKSISITTNFSSVLLNLGSVPKNSIFPGFYY